MNFRIDELGKVAKLNMIESKVWQAGCPISLDQLVSVKVLHYNFSGEIKSGELIVHRKMAKHALDIFFALKQIKFPIEQITPIENFAGDDESSMEHNNSSCFNYRKIANSDFISLHSYGLAIDLNPLQNPVITFQDSLTVINPILGREYLNRMDQRPGMVEQVVGVFTNNGFKVWGGTWKELIDYHHFQVERSELVNFVK